MQTLTSVPAVADWIFPLCPPAPPWRIPWPELLASFPDLRALENCPQDPEYHAEGNVLIHTQMVCAALVSNPAWQQLPAGERSILFTAALFHDIAKPSTTQIGEDGRWHARGHGKKGGGMVRALLTELNVPFGVREAIVNIVTMGSLPLWFWDKSDPQRSILFASQVSRCEWLALMADADLKGRICQDGQKFADSIALFEEFCQEQGCWDRPFAFASDHSRYIYFHKESADPFYEAYDITKFEVILTCAIPGTGKDYWIQQHHPDLPVVSLDNLRTASRPRSCPQLSPAANPVYLECHQCDGEPAAELGGAVCGLWGTGADCLFGSCAGAGRSAKPRSGAGGAGGGDRSLSSPHGNSQSYGSSSLGLDCGLLKKQPPEKFLGWLGAIEIP
jgi:hypothetical protein